jgi:hypothetical protein
MFGNVQGWAISAVMLLATTGALIYMGQPPKESVSHNAVPLAFKPIALPIPADSIQSPPTEDCDAADPYAKAISLYLDNPAIYQRAAQVDAAQVPAVALILEGANCSHMHLFDRNPTQAISYGKKPWIDAVAGLGEATTNAALRLKAQHHPEDAQKYYAAAFELGRKLFEERVSWAEANQGLTIMYTASGELAKLANQSHDTARVDACQHFADQTHAYRDTLQEKVASPLGNPAESYSAPFAGDVFAAAKDVSADRIWRVEAIMHLGHYRFDVAPQNKGDMIWASRELDALGNSIKIENQDVAIKTAIRAAQNLTAEQHHMTGNAL